MDVLVGLTFLLTLLTFVAGVFCRHTTTTTCKHALMSLLFTVWLKKMKVQEVPGYLHGYGG